MKSRILIIVLLISGLNFAQTPFTTLSMEPIKVKKDKNAYVYVKEVKDAQGSVTTKETATTEETIKKPIDFFNNSSLSTSLINTGNRVSISAEVLHYKLYVANPDAEKLAKGDRKYRFNIPMLLISKLSTQYDSINSASSWDVLDYEAAPLTLRIMPSFKKPFVGFNDVIYYGFYADVRGLNIQNNITNSYDMEFIGSGGIGFTYQGDGDAGKYNENGEYKPGRYSLSVMLQGATGKKEVLQKLFKTDNDVVTSLQAYFLFKVADDSKFNMKIGYQYLFKETLAGNKSNFTIAIGI